MKRQQKITVRSYVHYRGETVEFCKLPQEDKEKAATELAIRYFNTMFAGRAVFTEAENPAGQRPGGEILRKEGLQIGT